ncbi:DEAD/DEAH box helicase [Companilactobacillus metriopterae]|uniref:DEAD/DEAH box helicase n=1 Tax=Companilactobacillus metriopterae TaxID=1909267 RepID=UPI00100A376D|nr:DEAD/DEAH box helicase [Companilactobacillus metriopterae]
MENINQYLGGRITLKNSLDLDTINYLNQIGVKEVPGIEQLNEIRYRCNRCISEFNKVNFKSKMIYCRNCINLGRIKLGDQILVSNADVNFEMNLNPLYWLGELTTLQKRVSQELLESYKLQENHLVWAVTGAGKTEIIFPLLKQAIMDGKRVAICSPRLDVCNELYPRLKSAFPDTSMSISHGKIEDNYHMTQVLIATVHQLIKFSKAFDLLIIDEVDAFPLNGNQVLWNAIQKSQSANASVIYLSATPPTNLLDEVSANKLNLSKLYQRFHGRSLPLPKLKLLLRNSLFMNVNPRIRYLINQWIKSNTRGLIFFPDIEHMNRFYLNLKKIYPDIKINQVHSKDPQRIEKIQKFRDSEVDILLTTTILERGVTFKQIDVIVIHADSARYSKMALIQIAGRVGRDSVPGSDKIYFFYNQYNKNISGAVKEIKRMNRLIK